MTKAKNKTVTVEDVVTGIDVRDGSNVVKKMETEKLAADRWSTEDREDFTAVMAGEGSLNGRKFNFNVGDVLKMNADEAKLFATYITKVEK